MGFLNQEMHDVQDSFSVILNPMSLKLFPLSPTDADRGVCFCILVSNINNLLLGCADVEHLCKK